MLRVLGDLARPRRPTADGRGRPGSSPSSWPPDLADELHLVVAPFFVGDSRAHRFVDDGDPFPGTTGARLAEVRQIGDVVLLRYALSHRLQQDDPGGATT